MNKKIIATVMSVFFSTIVFSQTLSFRCNFTDGQITNFDSGAPSTKHESKFAELVFDQIDTTKKKARMIGNFVVAQVKLV